MHVRLSVAILFCLSCFCLAQQPVPGSTPTIGFVAPQGRSLPLFDAFKSGLADRGYQDGTNLRVEARFAEGQYERFPAIFQELLDKKVSVLAVTGAVTARAAIQSAGTTTPIVFSIVVDPVADKVVQSMEHPGGNVTGITTFDPQQANKQMALLKEALPGLRRIAILGDQGVSEALISSAETAAHAHGIQPLKIRLAGPKPDLESAFAQIHNGKVDALLVLEEPVLGVYAEEIATRANEQKLPTLFPPSRVAAGGLLCYGVSQTDAVRHMADYIDRILKGANPGDLPVTRIDHYDLFVNLKTAKTLGISLPEGVLKRADRVIQ